MEMEISELCEVDPEEHSYVDLTVTFAQSEEGDILQGTPVVRVWL